MRIRLLILLTVCYSQTFAFTCYATLMKGECWKNYDVSITMRDGATTKVIMQAELKKETLWVRKKFECNPGQSLGFTATFSPKIWKDNKDERYYKKSFISLPETIKSTDSAWEVSVCFPREFSEVPIPPESSGDCSCKIANKIPKIKERIIKK